MGRRNKTPLRANVGVSPVEGADWTIVAKKGDTGPQGSGSVVGVTATSPVLVTGNPSMLPNISLGVVGVLNGGTGLNSAGAAGNFLRSGGAGLWLSMPITPLDIPSGSSNYIQNGTNIQSLANFNITGTGKAGILDAGEIRVSGLHGLRRVGDNFFAGPFAGVRVTTGTGNSFFGDNAGNANETGNDNAYFGNTAGFATTGSGNTFLGARAGATSNGNSAENTFIGHNADFLAPVNGDHNTLLGANAKLEQIGVNPLKYATAIGADAKAFASDMIIIGKEAGTYDGVARPADLVRVNGVLQTGFAATNTGARQLCYNNGIALCDAVPRLILKSPNGTCFQLNVTDSGALFTAVAICP